MDDLVSIGPRLKLVVDRSAEIADANRERELTIHRIILDATDNAAAQTAAIAAGDRIRLHRLRRAAAKMVQEMLELGLTVGEIDARLRLAGGPHNG